MIRLPVVYNVFLAVEFGVATAALVLFGLAHPADFRSRLWENGGIQGWNSNPNKRIYFYANHQEPPEVPLIWSQRLADSNLAVAILSFVIFFARIITSRNEYLPRYAHVLYDICLAALWITSLVGQNSGDFTDPEQASAHPWYLTRGCGETSGKAGGYCHIARACFFVSILAAVLYGGRVLLEVLVMAYHRGTKQARDWAYKGLGDEEEEKYSDVDSEAVVHLTVQDGRLDQGLSPVLAFFPCEEPDRIT